MLLPPIVVGGQFQSAPDTEAGRNNKRPVARSWGRVEFQSAPDTEAGRNVLPVAVGVARFCFNPLPTLRPGGTHDLADHRVHADFVSIRSRH